jgi:hypothetical protein
MHITRKKLRVVPLNKGFNIKKTGTVSQQYFGANDLSDLLTFTN